MAQRVYIETTIISYLTSRPNRDLIIAANQQVTQEWWEWKRQEFDLFISQLVINEISMGDPHAAKLRLNAINDIPLLELSEQAAALAEAFINDGVIPIKAAEDALHIAIATINGVDYLVTWNFKHIANATIRNRIEYVCRINGYEPPVICSPQELLED